MRKATWQAALDKEVHPKALAAIDRPVRQDGTARSIGRWLTVDGLTVRDFTRWLPDGFDTSEPLAGELLEDAAYAPYLARQDAELRDLRASETLELSADFPYERVPGLSNEMVERLSSARPDSLAAAGRIAGITPAALAALLVHARRVGQAAA